MMNADRNFTLYRVRSISCDGGVIGRTWNEDFFFNEEDANHRLRTLISENDNRNPKYPFKTLPEIIDGISGYCNWQFTTMLTVDKVEIK